MKPLNRRSLLNAIAALPFASSLGLAGAAPEAVRLVRAGEDRTGRPHKAARAGSQIDFKVLANETGGAMFVMENRDMLRGGPPRHVHFEQEEWFYLLDGGEVLMEIGDQKLRLRPGDSVLAPRNVPHVWAYIGERPGRMIFAFSPAAKIESFFEETSQPGAQVLDPARFERHGMKLVGPPLLG